MLCEMMKDFIVYGCHQAILIQTESDFYVIVNICSVGFWDNMGRVNIKHI